MKIKLLFLFALFCGLSHAQIIISPSQTNVLCNGACTGSATVNITGGSSPYTYSWSPSGGTGATASGLCAGPYTVTVSDGSGGNASSVITITQPPALTLSIGGIVNASCFGSCDGSVIPNASGGTGGYTYSPSANNLCAGTHTFTVTDGNNCTATATCTITEPGLLTPTVTVVGSSCSGSCTGSATVDVPGSGNGYTYSWTPTGGTGKTAIGLCPGTYTCIITKNGCVTNQTVAIPAGTLFATLSYTNVSCFGYCDGAAALNATGGTGPYTYSWLPLGGSGATANALCAGTYTGTVNDGGGCSFPYTFSITQPSSFSGTPTSTPASCGGCTDGTATANYQGGSGQYTFSWTPGGQTSATATGLLPGTYTVCVTKNSTGCTECNSVVVSASTGIHAQGILPVSVFPNPGSGIFVIRSEKQISRIEIFNMLGEKIYSAAPGLSEIKIDLANEAKGVYFYRLKNVDKIERTGKIIIE